MLGRTALVTGSARNMGRAIALALARSGADVVLHGRQASRDLEETAETVHELGRRAWYYPVDLEDPDQTTDFARRVTEDHAISVLVNNAAVRPPATLEEVTASEWHRVLRVNLTAPFELIQACAPGMRRRGWGRIVNIGGQDSKWGWGGRAHVVASKSALSGLTRCIAVELGPDGVTVNQVAPGLIRTARDSASYPDWGLVEHRMRAVMAIKRHGEVEDVAAAVAFLASPEAGFITGQEIHINGGGFPLLPDPRRWGTSAELPIAGDAPSHPRP